MAGDWIKLEHVTPDKPEVIAMAAALDIDHDAVVGKLIRLWIWADQQSRDGNVHSVTQKYIDRVSGVINFADAMLKVGWLRVENGALQFVNFDRHNGKTAKSRALTAARAKKKRHATRHGCVTPASRSRNDSSVTHSSLDINYINIEDSSNQKRVTYAPRMRLAPDEYQELLTGAEFAAGNEQFLTTEIKKASDWALSKGKQPKDCAAFLRNWLRKAAADRRRQNNNSKNSEPRQSVPLYARPPQPEYEEIITKREMVDEVMQNTNRH
jgi:hypothetical protein